MLLAVFRHHGTACLRNGWACSVRGLSARGEGAGQREGEPRRLIDGVVNRIVDQMSRGDFDPKLGPLHSSSGSAGGAGEAGGGGNPAWAGRGGGGGGGAVTYDYDAVPRSIDVDAFRKALSAALTEHAGAVGGGAGGASGGHLAKKLMTASPSERQAIAEETTRRLAEDELSKMLAEEPVPVVRSRLAGMLERSGY